MQVNEPANNIDRLLDVEMNVTVRFGKAEVPLREVVRFGVGSMIELNRTVDEPVELLVNNSPFARGEVVVIDGYYGVRVTEIGSQEERSQTLLSNTDANTDINADSDDKSVNFADLHAGSPDSTHKLVADDSVSNESNEVSI
jgi:flagellar motor switch protein FliN